MSLKGFLEVLWLRVKSLKISKNISDLFRKEFQGINFPIISQNIWESMEREDIKVVKVYGMRVY